MPERPGKRDRYFDLIVTVFATVQVVSDIVSSAKSVEWGVGPCAKKTLIHLVCVNI